MINKNDKPLHKVNEEGMVFKISRLDRFKGIWFARLSVVMFWVYRMSGSRLFRVIAEFCLEKAFSFSKGKIPVRDLETRRPSVSEDMKYLDREIDLDR